MTNVLIIDHDRDFQQIVATLGPTLGLRTACAGSLGEGLKKNAADSFDIVMARDRLPDGATSEVIARFLDVSCAPEVIVYTRTGEADEAERILKNGAWDYVARPATRKSLHDLLTRAILYRRDKLGKSRRKQAALCAELQSEGIVGSSPALQSCLDLVAKAAQSDANVLIVGESGTGKELFASAIHNISARRGRECVVVDCAALPQTLVESILFGHEKGAFTGADKNMPGLLKLADGGTLFLDEVGELTLDLQKRFLRVLQERTFRPVGSNVEVKSDFRLMAATNRNLQALVDKGEFREDLFFRLQAFYLELPALRNRPTDIMELAYYYVSRYCERHGLAEKSFSPDFLVTLNQYRWPGNVRELFHALERSILAAQDGDMLFPMHLPTNIRVQVTREALNGFCSSSAVGQRDKYLEEVIPDLQSAREKIIAQAEKEYIERLLRHTGGNIQQSCQTAGLSRSRFYALLKKYRITTSPGPDFFLESASEDQ